MNLPVNSAESICSTPSIGSISDIIQNLWMCVKYRVDKANRTLVLGKALLVNL